MPGRNFLASGGLLLALLAAAPAIAADFEVLMAIGVRFPQDIGPGHPLASGVELRLEAWGRVVVRETRRCKLVQVIAGVSSHTLQLTRNCSATSSAAQVTARLQQGESFVERVVQSLGGDAKADDPKSVLRLDRCTYMPKFSEEGDSSQRCPSGYALSGMTCFGHYCDDKVLRCCPYLEGRSDGSARNYQTRWISEEPPNNQVDTQWFLNGLTCRKNYCDDISPHQFESARLVNIGYCTYTDWFSEESGPRRCPAGKFVAGIACQGDYCDNLRLKCCRARIE